MAERRIPYASAAATVLAVVLFVAVNVLAGALFRNARLDLTEDGLYTLSAGTERILENLSEPLTFRLFFSDKLSRDIPVIRDYERRVRELIEQYVSASDGLIRLERIDPEPFSDEEDLAVVYDLQGVPVSTAGERLYFGLVATNSTDDTERIPFFEREREAFLEYDLTRIVYDLANPQKPVIGLVSSLPFAGGLKTPESPPTDYVPPWALHGRMLELFEVVDLGTEPTEIGDDIDVLMVVHPKTPSEETLYAIDQFVMSGRGALFFVDPFSEIEHSYIEPRLRMTHIPYSNLDELFSPWGFRLSPGRVVGDRLAARKVSAGGRQDMRIVDYILWLALLRPSFNQEDIATADLERIFMNTVGSFEPGENLEGVFEALVTTTPESMEIERFRIQARMDPGQLLADFVAGGVPRPVAARITGPVPSAFPDGPGTRAAGDGDGEGEGEDAPPAPPASHLARTGDAHVVVVADTDLLADSVWVSTRDFFGRQTAVPVADNGSFVINLLEQLVGGEDLIGLRSRGSSVRPFVVVQDLEREAETRYRQTERALQAQLEETEQRLRQLQGTVAREAEEGAPILTPEQRETIAEFREQIVSIRKRLRDVQYELRSDIDALATRVEMLNIYLMPVLVVALALVVPLLRRRRRAGSAKGGVA